MEKVKIYNNIKLILKCKCYLSLNIRYFFCLFILFIWFKLYYTYYIQLLFLKNVGLMTLTILTVYSLKLETCLYQHFSCFLSETKEEGYPLLSKAMNVSTWTLRLIPSYLYMGYIHPFLCLMHLQSLMTISHLFKKNDTKKPSLVLSFPSYLSVSLLISSGTVSSSFKNLLSALSLLDIMCSWFFHYIFAQFLKESLWSFLLFPPKYIFLAQPAF